MPSESTSIQSDVDGPTPLPERSITLRVGERLFTTFPSTLVAGSSFFASLLSTRWASSKSDDDCYFVDADPELFAHILSYLRREVLPIIYDKSHGFDHAFYQALEVEAGYFGVEKLRKWVGEKGYLRAVTIQYSVEEVKGEGYSGEGYSTTVDGNTERSYYPSWTIDKVYQCPRGIFVHSGNPGACGRACESAKGDGGNQYVERSLLRTLIVTKRTIFNDVTVANQLGLFTNDKLDVSFLQILNSTYGYAQLLKGNYDILTGTIDNAVKLRFNQRQNLTVLGQLDGGPDLVIASVPSITSIPQLKGKSLMVDSPSSGYAFVLRKVLSLFGLSLGSDYYFQTVGSTTLRYVAGSLPNGSAVHATILTYPFTAHLSFVADPSTPTILASISDYIQPFSSSAFTVTQFSLGKEYANPPC